MQPAQAQAEPEAAHALHHAAADVAGEEVPREAVPVDRRARRVLQFAAPDGDAGEDLVPEPSRQSQAVAGGGNRENQDGDAAAVRFAVRSAPGPRPPLAAGRAPRCVGGAPRGRRAAPAASRGHGRRARRRCHGPRRPLLRPLPPLPTAPLPAARAQQPAATCHLQRQLVNEKRLSS